MCAARSATDSRTRRTVLREFEIKRRMSLTPVCCSSASERCPRASASSRVRASSCSFNSVSELGPSLTCALAFVPVERSLRLRIGLFAPLRDKVTSSAQSLVPSGQPSLSILTEPRDELAPPHSITSSARNWNDSGILWLVLRGFGSKLAELIRRVTTHSRGPRNARAGDGGRELRHRLAIRHIQGQDNVVLAGRHIGAEQLSAQFFRHVCRGLKPFFGVFRILGALVGPVE